MPQLVLVSVVAHGAEVVVGTLGALPADAEDGLLPAGVAHGALVLDACRSAVDDTQVVGARTPIIGSSTVVPDDHDFLGRFEVPYRAEVPVAAVLFAPFPVGSPHHPGPDAVHDIRPVGSRRPARIHV
uniref:Uncharacterized protein n=1 Tax=Ixodes ricinus TaxID=34613 RepID=A0A6B0UQ71_IXORI